MEFIYDVREDIISQLIACLILAFKKVPESQSAFSKDDPHNLTPASFFSVTSDSIVSPLSPPPSFLIGS